MIDSEADLVDFKLFITKTLIEHIFVPDSPN